MDSVQSANGRGRAFPVIGHHEEHGVLPHFHDGVLQLRHLGGLIVLVAEGLILQTPLAGILNGHHAALVGHSEQHDLLGGGTGGQVGHAVGHGVGLEIHEEPGVGPRSKGELEIGSVITIEPGIYLPGKFGVRIEDMLYISPDSTRNLTNTPKGLLIL